MGPQPFSRGNVKTLAQKIWYVVLQWGRNLSVAETGWSGITYRRYDLSLQWGRNLSVAETRRHVLRADSLADEGRAGASMGPQPLSRGN